MTRREINSPQELRRQLSGAGVHRGSHGRVISRSGLCLDGVMFVRVVPHNVTSTWKLNRRKMLPTVRRTFLQSAPHQSKQSTSVMQRQPRSKIYIVTFGTTPPCTRSFECQPSSETSSMATPRARPQRRLLTEKPARQSIGQLQYAECSSSTGVCRLEGNIEMPFLPPKQRAVLRSGRYQQPSQSTLTSN